MQPRAHRTKRARRLPVSGPAEDLADKAADLARQRSRGERSGGRLGQLAHQHAGQEEFQKRLVSEAEPVLALAHEERPAERFQKRRVERHIRGQVATQLVADQVFQVLDRQRRLARVPQVASNRLGQFLLLLGLKHFLIATVRLLQPAIQIRLVQPGLRHPVAGFELIHGLQHHAQQQRSADEIFQRVQRRDFLQRLVGFVRVLFDLPDKLLDLCLIQQLQRQAPQPARSTEHSGQSLIRGRLERVLGREVVVPRRDHHAPGRPGHAEQCREPFGKFFLRDARGHFVKAIKDRQHAPGLHEQLESRQILRSLLQPGRSQQQRLGSRDTRPGEVAQNRHHRRPLFRMLVSLLVRMRVQTNLGITVAQRLSRSLSPAFVASGESRSSAGERGLSSPLRGVHAEYRSHNRHAHSASAVDFPVPYSPSSSATRSPESSQSSRASITS